MICQKCGHENKDEFNFCEKCAFKLKEYLPQSQQIQQQFTQPKKKGTGCIIAVSVFCSVVVFAVIIILIFIISSLHTVSVEKKAAIADAEQEIENMEVSKCDFSNILIEEISVNCFEITGTAKTVSPDLKIYPNGTNFNFDIQLQLASGDYSVYKVQNISMK